MNEQTYSVYISMQWNSIYPLKIRTPAFVTTWITSEGIILSVISQAEKEKYCICVKSKKSNS
jgi:hypothetical protein